MPGNSPLAVGTICDVLAETPPRIEAAVSGLDDAQLHTSPELGEWSANLVLAHLRACADMWGGAMLTIVREDEPTIRAINPLTWITRTDYPDQDFRPSFEAFCAQRAALLSVLTSLSPGAWSRTATVTGAGALLERTVLVYGTRLARHERQHWKQFEATGRALSR